MKKILVPVDFSKPSEYAARIATKIAKKIGAVIYLIHLIEIPSGVVDMGASSKFSIPESMLYLRKTKEKIVTPDQIADNEDVNNGQTGTGTAGDPTKNVIKITLDQPYTGNTLTFNNIQVPDSNPDDAVLIVIFLTSV